MDSSKDKLLYKTHQKLMDLALDNKQPLTELKKVVTEDVMGFGTAFDEKILSIKEFVNLIKIQREQSEGMEMDWKINPIMRRISEDTNTAVFADDLLLSMNMEEETVSMQMRLSTIFEFTKDSWKLVHWHGSKPENVASETDTFGIDVWKQKNAELEKLVKERTEELIEKNKELEIEAALERVRARTIAMKKSDELVEASRLLDQQVRALGIETWGCAFHIYGESDSDELAWDEEWFSSEQGILTPYQMPRENIFKKYYEKGKEGKPLHIEEIGEDEIEDHYEYLQSLPIIGEALKEAFASGVPLPKSQFDHVAFFDHGHLLFITYEPVPEAHDIFVRFAQVFRQTYTRFLDLQKAEKQARESQIEAALERVRTKTMAMHNSNDVSDTVLTLFKEIQKLGLDSSIRCGICIDQGTDHMQTWSVSAWSNRVVDLKTGLLNMTAHPLLIGARKAWKNKSHRFTYSLKGKEVKQYYKVINEEPDYPFFVELETLPDTMHLNTFNFSEGFLFSFTPNLITDETGNILNRFTGVFGQTYRRYLDLLNAEAQALQAAQDLIDIKAARKKAEEALVELKATQSQLIQSEKMASLGELTAGIAHEIQNPLNFVNNFSEVSSEMIEEMNEELDKNDVEEARAIAADIKQNLEKINHHGKRADAIVKGMLQHSRSSTGEKELTKINVLADEYLRLAYHGLRAKDKSFNATLVTEFDESIGKVNISRQDIGRVLLNLINNAFYAVDEKKKQAGDGYQPTVAVSTKKLDPSENPLSLGEGRGEAIQIIVKDNGNGIPEQVREKIFQPFFTTKPTGQGTGLGLSLSYDIIKAHGGELKVDTIEGKGSEFIIQLPNV